MWLRKMWLLGNTTIAKGLTLLKRASSKRISMLTAALTLCAVFLIQPNNVQAAECNEAYTISAGEYHTVAVKEDEVS